MFTATTIQAESKAAFYQQLAEQARGLLSAESNRIANAANFSAIVFHALENLNWAGFYLFDGKELVVGPFQGQPACVRIALGRGVCGTAAQTRTTQLVHDVEQFPGHIACDAASRSEIVVPLITGSGELFGVWDVDSPLLNRFDTEDQSGMELLCQVFMESISA